jgi:hypothetical protein
VSLSLVMAVIVMVGCGATVESSSAAAKAVSTCSASSVRITERGTLAGGGNVDDLFCIRYVSRQTCSFRGSVRIAYDGVYGIAAAYENPRRLVVGEANSDARDGNDIGGLRKGRDIPTVTLTLRGVWHRSGSMAPMKQPGTPLAVASSRTRCWRGCRTPRV